MINTSNNSSMVNYNSYKVNNNVQNQEQKRERINNDIKTEENKNMQNNVNKNIDKNELSKIEQLKQDIQNNNYKVDMDKMVTGLLDVLV